jgi:hypothetical protein
MGGSVDHARHVPGTVADCEECRRIAVEPGWYKRLAGSEAPEDPGASAEDAGEPHRGARRADAPRLRPAAARDVDLAAAELERRRMRVDLSRAEDGATRVDLPDDDERERAASKRDRSD